MHSASSFFRWMTVQDIDRSDPGHHIDDLRARAMAWLNALLALLPSLYLPFVLSDSFVEISTNLFLTLYGIYALLLLGNIWLCYKHHTDVAITLLCVAIFTVATFLTLELEVVVTTVWFLVIAGLLSCFVKRPWLSITLSATSLVLLVAYYHIVGGTSIFPRAALEYRSVASATIMISIVAFLTSRSYRRIQDDLSQTRQRVEQATAETKAQEARAQHALREARAANEEKSAFLAAMSHELRTPLNSILGYAELLREDFEQSTHLPQAILEDTDSITIASHHLLELIQDVLDLSHIESGALTMAPHPFDLREMCSQIIASMELAASLRHNTLTLHDTALVHRLEGYDPTWVRQILFNLLSNAIKFTEHGTVTLEVHDTPRGKLRIGVRDTGIGLTRDQLERITEEFVQADDHTVKEFGGTGLGLPLCLKLSELMGSELHIESVLDQGTFAFFDLEHATEP